MQISKNGINLIQEFEGCVLEVYLDIVGNPTIGFGHKLLPGESFPNGITETQAIQILMQDITPVENYLSTLVTLNLNQNQFDAFCSFGFNLGNGSLKELLAHGLDQVSIQILLWNHAGRKVVPGLTARRQAELALFQLPVNTSNVSIS